MAGHSFPVSLGLPRWRPCQIPDPGEGTLSQFPVGSPPPRPWGLTLIGALEIRQEEPVSYIFTNCVDLCIQTVFS